MADETKSVDKGVAERGRAVVTNAREKAEHLLESARDGTGNLQATVADGLEARGAEVVHAHRVDVTRADGVRETVEILSPIEVAVDEHALGS